MKKTKSHILENTISEQCKLLRDNRRQKDKNSITFK